MRLLRSLLLILSCASSLAIAAKYQLVIEHTPAGIHSAYATRSDWDAAVGSLRWNTPPDIAVTTGDTGSQNARSLLLDDSGSAVITAICVPALPTAGFASGANGIQWSSATAYVGVCQYNAKRSIFPPAISASFSVTATAPPAGDTTAPTIPTGGVGANGTGQVTITHDASSDAYVGERGSLASYDYTHSAGGTTNVPAVKGLSAQFTCTNVGSIAAPGAPVGTQSGVNWSLTAAGTGFVDSTSDQFLFCHSSVTGAAKIIAKIASVGTATTFSSGGVCIRKSLDANSAALCIRWQQSSGGTLQCRGRAQDGANKTTYGTQTSFALPGWVALGYDGSGSETCESSPNGNTWTTFGTPVISLGASPFYGPASSSSFSPNPNGINTTSSIEQVNLQNVGRISVVIPTLVSGTISIRAKDTAGNASSYGAPIAIAPTAPADVTPPSVPGSVVCTSGGQTSINCTSAVSTDASGIRGYVWGCSATQLGTYADAAEQPSTSFTLSGLTASTTRWCKPKAVDSVGNVSAYGTPDDATTDSMPPPAFTAPAISSVSAIGLASPTTSLRITHTAVTGAHHYIVREAATVSGTYAIVDSLDHTSLTVDRIGLAASTQRCYQVAAANSDETTVGPYTATGVCGTTQAASTGNAHKWHPGVYAWVGAPRLENCGTAKCHLQDQLSFMDATCAETALEGHMIRMYPQSMVGPTGDYTKGFALWDRLIKKARDCGQRVMLGIQPVAFNTILTTAAACADYMPAYVCSDPNIGYTAGTQSTYMPVWNARAMDELIKWWKAYGARYDGDPNVELIEPVFESAVAVPKDRNGFSNAALFTQFERLYREIKPSWKHTMLRFHGNYAETAQQFRSIYTLCRTLGCAFGGPDVLPAESIMGNQIYAGCLDKPCATFVGDDLRGRSPMVTEVQAPELGGKEGKFTAQVLWEAALLGYTPTKPNQTWGTTARAVQPTHWVWYVNRVYGDAPQRWDTGLLPFARLHPSTGFTACPTDFVLLGGCQ